MTNYFSGPHTPSEFVVCAQNSAWVPKFSIGPVSIIAPSPAVDVDITEDAPVFQPPPNRDLCLLFGRRPSAGKPAEEALRRVLGDNPARLRVKHLAFWHYSQLSSAWPVTLFPIVESIRVVTESMKSFSELRDARHLRRLTLDIKKRKGNLEFLQECGLESLCLRLTAPGDRMQIANGRGRLKSLELLGKTGPNLQGLEAVECESFELLRADTRSLEGLCTARTRTISLSFCPKLADLGPLGQTRSLEMMACGNIRWEDIRDAPCLERVWLRSSPRAIEDFSFVRNLPSLQSLSICRVRIETADLGPLIACPTLRRVLLVGAQRDALAKLAAARPDMARISGRAGEWRNGKEVPALLR